jgi:serine/threonine protein kinase
LAVAIGYLHSNLSVVYRDLKLENILLTENGYVKIVDFGISKQLDVKARERTFSLRGTPEYMAPEILIKKGYSFEVDWWALGTLAYELIFG